jgi:16S rRNA C967 or C1407 C5-methylase (RsmB/RsmF family)/NOL1/NOP2/fmu family ribosome biogenesis protein
MSLPIDFRYKLKEEHPSYSDRVIEALSSSPATLSIRYNLLKHETLNIESQVSWCGHAMYLDTRPSFTMDPLFHAGAYYVQEASSMILYYILNQLSIPENPHVLDLCAAPGGKSTLILDYLQEKGLLVANEVIKARSSILQENIMKWGYGNAIVTSNDPKDFGNLPSFFDVVVVDAPCSGEGMFRKDTDAIGEWSSDHVHHCALRQQRIIADVIPSLKKNGYLIYSTCTFNHEENIDNILSFIDQYGFKSVDVPMDDSWGISKITKNDAIGFQFFPGITKGEGFFVAVLQKTDGDENGLLTKIKKNKLQKPNKNADEILNKWVAESDRQLLMTEKGNVYSYNDAVYNNIEHFLLNLNVKYSGILAGNLQKNVFIPDHALALSHIISDKIKFAPLDKNEALQYLSRSLNAIKSPDQSWLLASYDGVALGWLKNLGNRINNYFPTELRIKKDITPFME